MFSVSSYFAEDQRCDHERNDPDERNEDDRDEEVGIHVTARVADRACDRDRGSALFRVGRATRFECE
jgi:hypothetical protein